MRFRDRRQAGQGLATRLTRYAHRPDVLVFALPRGGVPVGYEVAQALSAPLDVFVVPKLGVPGCSELALGAIASGGVRVLNESVVSDLHISQDVIEAVAAQELDELDRRQRAYRGDQPALDVRGRTVVLVDDGIATGSTMRAAIVSLRQLAAGQVSVAVPVVALSTASDLRSEVDDFVALITPTEFAAVGQWYDDFSQTSDEEVRELLRRAHRSFTVN